MSAQLEYSVLIVDDDITTIKLMADSLTSEFNVSFATSALTGIELAQKVPQPDVILLDVLMPDIDGYELCRQLKQEPSTQHIPVIFVTSLSDASEQELGFGIGAVDYIAKPIQVPLLKARVRTQAKLRKYICQLESLATTDPLTSCANRRRYEEVLDTEWKLAIRNQTPISMLMIDVDDFKAYNDNYGHGKGDECLIAIGKMLTKSLSRPTDIVARYGGEEFAIIMPNTDNEGAVYLAKKILATLKELKIEHAYSSVENFVTLSIGVASITNATISKQKDCLANQADKALYKAKETEKFTFCVA